jgi:hypothetical protein
MPCQPSTNLAPTQINSLVNGKTVQVIGVPPTSPTIRNTCNQALDFTKIYLTIGPDGSNKTVATGTSNMPIVDYVAQAKTLTSENSRIKNQMDILNRQIASLQNSVSILRGGGKLPVDTSTATPDTTDYKALASSLQLQVDALKKKIAATTPKSKTTAKPKVTAKPKTTPKPAASSTSQSAQKISPTVSPKPASPTSGSRTWQPSQGRSTWSPSQKQSWSPKP